MRFLCLRNALALHLGAGFELNGEMKEPSENGSSMTVGRTERVADVGVPTMRFYERAGLLPKRKVLLRLAEQCDAGRGDPSCPLLEFLESDL